MPFFSDYTKTLYFLARAPGYTREKILDFQFVKLAAIVTHAYNNVPFYKTHYDRHGFHPRQLKNLEDISRIPIVNREDLTLLPSHETTSITVPKKRLIKRSTSGTTGVPLLVYRTWLEERLLNAFRWRAEFSFGLKPGDLTASIRPWKDTPNLLHRLLMAANCLREEIVNGFDQPERILAHLEVLKPDILMGYPGVVEAVARCITPDSPKNTDLKFIITGGETLSPRARSAIRSGFNTRVFDIYGTYEFNLVAWECKTTGDLHVCDDNMILEVLDHGKPVCEGETGEVVGTALHSFGMPFIRYRLGDMVTKGFESCRCGLPFSTLRRVEGRVTDYFILPDGSKMHPYKLLKPIWDHVFSSVSQYRIVQETIDQITISLVFKDKQAPSGIDRLRQVCREIVGNDVRLTVETTDTIPLSKSGKTLIFRSLVNGPP